MKPKKKPSNTKITNKSRFEKKVKLSKHGRRTKWAPVWVVMKKYGKGKKIHPSKTTRVKRSWRRTKLHITPRKQRKSHFG